MRYPGGVWVGIVLDIMANTISCSSLYTCAFARHHEKRIAFRGPPYNWPYMLKRPWEIVSWLWREICWFIQRGLYGYSGRDLWSLDYYLTTWLPPALRELALTVHGHPPELTIEQWQQTLNEIADGLDAGREWFDEMDNINAPPEFTKAMEQLHRWFWSLWD